VTYSEKIGLIAGYFNKIEVLKVGAVIMWLATKKFFFFYIYNLNFHYFLSVLVKFYILKENFHQEGSNSAKGDFS